MVDNYKGSCISNTNDFSKFLCAENPQGTLNNWIFLPIFIVVLILSIQYFLRERKGSFKEYLKMYIPSVKGILISIGIWILLEVGFMFLFGGCIYGDCIREDGQWTNCCGSFRSSVAEIIHALKSLNIFPIIAYITGTYLLKNSTDSERPQQS